jgi:hypothetical protein
MIAEAVLRLPLIYVIPLNIAVGASTAFMVVVIGSLAAWTAVVTRRALVPPRQPGYAATR